MTFYTGLSAKLRTARPLYGKLRAYVPRFSLVNHSRSNSGGKPPKDSGPESSFHRFLQAKISGLAGLENPTEPPRSQFLRLGFKDSLSSCSHFNDGSVAGSTETLLRLTLPRILTNALTRNVVHPLFIPYIWLRDHCHCGECINLETMQRRYDAFSAPRGIKPNSVELQNDSLHVKWNDGHESSYPWTWLLRHIGGGFNEASGDGAAPQGLPLREFFDSSIKNSPPSVDYEEIMSADQGLTRWMALIYKYGFSFVDNCPVSPENTQKLLERISFIRQTHYGGFYDFTSDLTMKDTAYTSEALDAHTDTTYFTDPIGHQMFHLLSHTNGSGGESLLVDGFRCASILARENREAYQILYSHKYRQNYHSSGNESVSVRPSGTFPVIDIDDGSNFPSEIFMAPSSHPPWDDRSERIQSVRKFHSIRAIRWNRYDRASYDCQQPLNKMSAPMINSKTHPEKWYEAAREWSEIVKRSDGEYWEQLRPGKPLIFDNHRVLHGRSAFTGNRRICGGYLNHDDFRSRLLNLCFPRKEVLESI